MKFNKLYFEKYKDIFNYHSEIQNINSGFRLYFNKYSKKITIVNIYNNFEICYEFDSIFKIDLNKLRFSQIKNIDKVIKYIEESNSQLEFKAQKNREEFIKNTSKEFIKLSNRQPSNNLTNINKIIGATKC